MRWQGKHPLQTFKVESRHKHPDTSEPILYNVELWGDGEIDCDCMAGSYKRKCWHKREILDKLSEEFGSLQKAIDYFRKKIQ
ncbi:hypothetical protein LCGC14_2593430 [marine sediment metagenome]|uniref:SWIM-type domain-containing protein n=1 Tax=marine sediment metagenome TaxID=412755 RepID=A0A0F9CM30_9ZZZZ